MERRGRLFADLGYPVIPRLARKFVVVGRLYRFSTFEKQLRALGTCMGTCMHYLRAGCRTGGVDENMCMPDITMYNSGSTTYIESAARNGSAVFDESSSSCWMGVPLTHIMHTASRRCEIAGSGGANRLAQ